MTYAERRDAKKKADAAKLEEELAALTTTLPLPLPLSLSLSLTLTLTLTLTRRHLRGTAE